MEKISQIAPEILCIPVTSRKPKVNTLLEVYLAKWSSHLTVFVVTPFLGDITRFFKLGRRF